MEEGDEKLEYIQQRHQKRKKKKKGHCGPGKKKESRADS